MFIAAFLAPHYPNIEFIFTDTKAEPESCYNTLDAFEKITGLKDTRLVPEKGLFDLIEQYNGFLPNNLARWCTRQLNVEALTEYKIDSNKCISYLTIEYREDFEHEDLHIWIYGCDICQEVP